MRFLKEAVKLFHGKAAPLLNHRSCVRMLSVVAIPALQDNYMYLLIDTDTKVAAIVDPVDPKAVLDTVSKENVTLKTVLTTHHHWDHAGGNEDLVKKQAGLAVYGGDERIGALTNKVQHGDRFQIGTLDVQCLFTPCHTKGHICYHVTDRQDNKAVFTGDTLFIGGCGRFFEGTPQQMYQALIEVLGTLPNDTKVYCGHEYTVKNLQFAKHVEPNNKDVNAKLEWAKKMRERHEYTVPSTIGDEKLYNPFMRVASSDTLKARVKSDDPVVVMGHIRNEKDHF